MRSALAMLTSGALALSSAGCTLIGYGVGSAIDRSQEAYEKRGVLPGSELSNIDRGERVDLELRLGGTLSGKFVGCQDGESVPEECLLSRQDGEVTSFNQEDVFEIVTYDQDRTGTVLGTSLGLTLDVVVIVWFFQTMNDFEVMNSDRSLHGVSGQPGVDDGGGRGAGGQPGMAWTWGD